MFETTTLRFKKILTGTFIIRAVSLAMLPFYTKILSVDEYGQFSLLIASINIISSILSFNIFESIVVFTEKDNLDTKKTTKILYSLIIYILIISVLISLIYNSIHKIIEFETLIFIYIGVFMQVSFLMIKNLSIALKNSTIYLKRQITETLVVLVLSVSSMLLFTQFVYKARVYSLLIGQLISVLLVYKISFYSVRYLRLNRPLIIKCFKYSLPKMPFILSGILLSQVDRFIIEDISGLSKTAYYSVAYTFAGTASILAGVFWQAKTTDIYEELGSEKGLKRNYFNKYFIYYGMFILLLSLFLGPLMDLLMPKKYNESISLVPFICLGYFFFFASGIYNRIVEYSEKTFLLIPGVLFSLILNILLNYWLIPIFDYKIAALTTAFSYLCQLILTMYIVKSRLKFSISLKPLLLVSLILTISITLLQKLFKHFYDI